jgi:DNA-directed RNA polymerase subunit RPC12/RpoP
MQKIVCPQCGSNELTLFGSSAYKCESCGTILKDDKPQQQKPFRSKRIARGLEDEADLSSDFSEDHHEAGGQFLKLIFWIGIIGGLGGLCAWLLF